MCEKSLKLLKKTYKKLYKISQKEGVLGHKNCHKFYVLGTKNS